MFRANAAIAITCSSLFVAHAPTQAATVTFTINVVKQSYGDDGVKPFPGVGVFDLLRGATKLDGAACPDKSGHTGALNCKVPCTNDAKEVMVLRVKPPSNQDSLAGWVTPPPQDIQIAQCKVKPATVTMRYEDARLALNALSKEFYASTGGVPVGGGGPAIIGAVPATEIWKIILIKDPAMAAKFGVSVTSENGKANAKDVYRFATEATKSPELQSGNLTKEEQEQAAALAQWQVLSKSALLFARLAATLPTVQNEKIGFKPTTDVVAYRASLEVADQLLEHIPRKNPDQLQLADDIKTLKSLPTTGKEAAAASAIIDKWR